MAGIDHTGKIGGGGEFAKSVEQWQTRNVPNGGRTMSREDVLNKGSTDKGKRQVGLENQVTHLWRTPDTNECGGAQDAAKRLQGGHSLRLQDQAHSWPTPNAVDSEDAGGPQQSSLVNAATGRYSPLAPAIPDGPESSSDSPTSRPRLNPAFAAWLMGLPPLWTNPAVTSSEQLAMAAYRARQQQLLSALFDDSEMSEAA